MGERRSLWVSYVTLDELHSLWVSCSLWVSYTHFASVTLTFGQFSSLMINQLTFDQFSSLLISLAHFGSIKLT